MAEGRPHEAEGNGRHDQDRLPVRPETDCYEHVHHDDRDRVEHQEFHDELGLRLGVAALGERNVGMAVAPFRHELVVEAL